MKTIIRLTEDDLHRIIKESVKTIINESNEERIDEGWKNWAMAGALGAASLFANPQTASAQKYQYQENPYVNRTELANHKYSQKYDITYDNEDTHSIIYDLVRCNAKYINNMTPEVVAKIQKYPKYDKSIPIENFLKQNKKLIDRCGGKVGGIDSSVTFVSYNNAFYLVPSDIRML